MVGKILVLIENDNNIKKYLMTIKKYTNLGFGEIKNRVESGSTIMECELFDDEDNDRKLKHLVIDLVNLGAKVHIYDGKVSKDNEMTVEHLKNRFNRFKEIQEQNQELDDLMYGDD